MSECEKAAPNAAKPPRASNAVRRAWKWVGAYALVQLCFYIYFEWRIVLSGKIHEYAFLTGLVLFFFLAASLYLFIKSLLRRERAAALLYAALFAINLASPRIGMALDQTAKAFFFSAFPEMCPEGSPKPGYRVFLCYKYWEIDSRTALALNPGDELAAPYTAWPPEFDAEIFREFVGSVDECQKKNTRLLVNHVYVVEDSCRGGSE
jgi:hypothetical protein